MPNIKEESHIASLWSKYWAKHQPAREEWDLLSELILRTLKQQIGDLRSKVILEAGCGTGRISARLAAEGAAPILLDITHEALHIARTQFPPNGNPHLVQASILAIPCQGSCDAVWSAGVLEHFSHEDQNLICEQLLGALKPGGLLITMVPYARCVPYRISKYLLEKSGAWPYGREIPFSSYRHLPSLAQRAGLNFTFCLLPFFFDLYKFIPALRPCCKALLGIFERTLGMKALTRADRAFSFICGGYLITNVVKR